MEQVRFGRDSDRFFRRVRERVPMLRDELSETARNVTVSMTQWRECEQMFDFVDNSLYF